MTKTIMTRTGTKMIDQVNMTKREDFDGQADCLSSTYCMPLKTVKKWMTAKNILGFDDWMDVYGVEKYQTRSEGYDACLQDITAWVMNSLYDCEDSTVKTHITAATNIHVNE